MKSISAMITELRNQLASAENDQLALLAERDSISFAAVVEKEATAVKRVAALNAELANTTNMIATVQAALQEAAKREGQAQAEAQADKRRADAMTAEGLLGEAEEIAKQLDQSFWAIQEHAVAFENKMSHVRRLTGVGPRYDAIRPFLFRALRSAVHRGPLHIDAVAPSEITTVTQVALSWAGSIRTQIAATLDKTAPPEATISGSGSSAVTLPLDPAAYTISGSAALIAGRVDHHTIRKERR